MHSVGYYLEFSGCWLTVSVHRSV